MWIWLYLHLIIYALSCEFMLLRVSIKFQKYSYHLFILNICTCSQLENGCAGVFVMAVNSTSPKVSRAITSKFLNKYVSWGSRACVIMLQQYWIMHVILCSQGTTFILNSSNCTVFCVDRYIGVLMVLKEHCKLSVILTMVVMAIWYNNGNKTHLYLTNSLRMWNAYVYWTRDILRRTLYFRL